MSEIIDASVALNAKIKESKEYKRYIYAKNALKSHEDLYNRYLEFQKKNMELQTYGGDNLFDAIRILGEENDELVHNSLVNEYIRAEASLVRLMRNAFNEIVKDLELSYLGE